MQRGSQDELDAPLLEGGPASDSWDEPRPSVTFADGVDDDATGASWDRRRSSAGKRALPGSSGANRPVSTTSLPIAIEERLGVNLAPGEAGRPDAGTVWAQRRSSARKRHATVGGAAARSPYTFPWLPGGDGGEDDDCMWTHTFDDSDGDDDDGDDDDGDGGGGGGGGKRGLHARWFQTLLSVCASLMSGTYYSFGLYAERLKENGGFTQAEIAMVGYMLDLGVFGFRPLVGIVFDSFGPRPSYAMCCLIGGTGYLMVSEAVRADAQTDLNSVGFLSFAFVLVGIAGSLGYTSSLFLATSNFSPEARSVAVSLASSGMGLSPLLMAITFRYGYDSTTELPHFFMLWAVLLYSVFAASSLFAHVPNYKPKAVNLSEAVAAYRGLLLDPTFWLMAGPFALSLGVALMVANNSSSIARAIAGGAASYSTVETLAFELVAIFAVFSTASRLTVGQCMKRLPQIPAGIYLTMSCVVQAVGLIAFASVSRLETLYFLFVLVGLGVGSLWTACITLLKLFAPVEAFGQSFGLLCCMPAIVGVVLNSAAAHLYDENVETTTAAGRNVCVGAKCFRVILWVGFAVTALAGVWSLRLLKMTQADARKMRKAMHGHRGGLGAEAGAQATLLGKRLPEEMATAADFDDKRDG